MRPVGPIFVLKKIAFYELSSKKAKEIKENKIVNFTAAIITQFLRRGDDDAVGKILGRGERRRKTGRMTRTIKR